MPNITPGLHHFHRRKRIYKKHEPYPSKNKYVKIMDRLIFIVGILGPILTIPQLYRIWVEKNAGGISAVTWGSYIILDFFWLGYGIMHKEKPIIITFAGWIILNSLVVLGTLLYAPLI